MRWVPIGLVGAAAVAVGWTAGPLFYSPAAEPGYGLNVWMPGGWLAIVLYAPFFVAVVGGTVLAFRALHLSTRRSDLSARIALGSTRGSLIAGEARTGMRDGLLAGGGGIAVGALARQLVTGVSDVFFMSNTLWDYTAVIVLAVVCFTLAYWIAAAWATRGSVRDVASGTTAAARATTRAARGRRAPRARRRWVLTSTVTLAVLSLVTLIASPSFLDRDGTESGAALAGQVVAATVLVVGLYLAVPGLLVYAGAKVAVAFARRLGGALARSARAGTARSIAGDSLARPTPLRTGALSSVIVVMAVAVAGTAVFFGSSDAQQLADELAPAATVSAVDLHGDDALPASTVSGWVEPLPRTVLDAVRADPALTVIEAGVLVTDRREVTVEPGEATWLHDRDLLIAVDPAALDTVSSGAWKRLYLTDAVQWRYSPMLGWTAPFEGSGPHVAVEGVSVDTVTISRSTPWTGISRPWAEEIWGRAPTAALLVYTGGPAPVQEALARHDLGDLMVVTHDVGAQATSRPSGGLVAAATVPFLAIAVAIVTALAWSGQRLRARDQATLLALGATPSALRGAAALESFILTAVAATIGCLGGAIAGPALAEFFQGVPVQTTGAALVAWNMGRTLAVMPWSVLGGLVLGAACTASAGAALIRIRLDRLTPAQQLTEAQREGLS